jgi:DNA-binding CsgD family transcriptional regulator
MAIAPTQVKAAVEGTDGLPPLRGRESEIKSLRAALRGPARRSVVLVGPSGVGKTRLAREALRIADADGLASRWVVATRATSDVSYGGLVTLLRKVHLEGTSGPAELLKRNAVALSELAGRSGLLLGIDDAHLLDRASASLIQQLVADRIITVVATTRAREPVPEGITALWKDDLAVRLEVGGLPAEAIKALLEDALGGYVDPGTAIAVAARCEGNVLMFHELVRAALADGSLSDDLGVWRLTGALRPPDSLVELVEQRLAGLDARARELMEVIAYGEPLGRAELPAVGDVAAVTDLERAGLVVSEFSGRRLVLRPAHPVYGDVIRGLTPAVRVGTMARALADSIEACGARRREDVLRVGVLRLDGGGGSAETMLAAAQTARWHYDFPLAERLARASMDATSNFEAGLLAAHCRALQGDAPSAERELRELAELATDDEKRTRLATTLVDLLWLNLGRMEDAQNVAEEAQRAIGNPDLRSEVSARSTILLHATDGPRHAVEVADSELPLARGRNLAWLGIAGSFAFGRAGRISDALSAGDSAFSAGMDLSEPYNWYPWFGIYARCEALAQAGRYQEASELACEQYERGLRSGSTEARAFFLWHLARTAHDRGRPEVAIEQAREGMALYRQLGYLPHLHSVGSTLVLAYALAGRAREAAETIKQLDAMGIIGPKWSHCDHAIARAWVQTAMGNLAGARTELAEAADYGEEHGDLMGAAAALHDLARIGRPRQVVARLDLLATRCEGVLVAARAAHARALAADDAEALKNLAARFDEMGAHLLAAESATDAALRLSRAGTAQQMSRAEQRAYLYRTRCGDSRTPSLASIEVRTQLTSAEHETALLAAAGSSNREIAQQLQLSVRTVSNRLQRVYEKLGISSRRDLDGLLN